MLKEDYSTEELPDLLNATNWGGGNRGGLGIHFFRVYIFSLPWKALEACPWLQSLGLKDFGLPTRYLCNIFLFLWEFFSFSLNSALLHLFADLLGLQNPDFFPSCIIILIARMFLFFIGKTLSE